MPEIKHTVTINRPVGEIFRFVADFRNDPQWQGDVAEVHQTEGNTRIGTMLTETRTTRAWSWRMDLNADVIDYQPNKLIEMKGVIGRFPSVVRYEFAFSRGTTEFTQHLNIRLGFLYAIFSPFVTRAMNRRTRQSMEKLKAMMEERGSTGVTPIPEK
jgi:uncharacterized membrane protein